MSTTTTSPTNGDRRLAAFAHVAAMLLAFFEVSIFGIPFLNVLIPLVLLLAAREEKNAYLNHQLREVVRFQLITSVVMFVAMLAAILGAMSYPVITAPVLVVLLLAQVIFYLMPVIAACKVLFGKRDDYAYPMMGSPRRKAYVEAKSAPKADDTINTVADDADENTRL